MTSEEFADSKSKYVFQAVNLIELCNYFHLS